VTLLEAVAQAREAGLTEPEIAEILARTGPGREDEYDVIREVVARPQRPKYVCQHDRVALFSNRNCSRATTGDCRWKVLTC
jgi:hypothetical protein